jgi:hypothetical protein
VGPIASLDYVEKRKLLTLLGLELRPLGRPVHSQSLYQLRYPRSWLTEVIGVVINAGTVFNNIN